MPICPPICRSDVWTRWQAGLLPRLHQAGSAERLVNTASWHKEFVKRPKVRIGYDFHPFQWHFIYLYMIRIYIYLIIYIIYIYIIWCRWSSSSELSRTLTADRLFSCELRVHLHRVVSRFPRPETPSFVEVSVLAMKTILAILATSGLAITTHRVDTMATGNPIRKAWCWGGEGGETGNRGNLQTRSCSVPNFCTCVLSKLQWSLKYSVKVVEIASCVWVWETNTDQQKWMEGHWSKLTKSLSTSCASLTSQKPLPFSPEIQFCEAGYCRHKDQEN